MLNWQRRLRNAPMDALIIELRHRGRDVLPISQLLELRELQDRHRFVLDAGPVIRELGQLASETLPEAVAYAVDLGAENTRLRRRAARAEEEVDFLVAAAVGRIIGEDESEEA